MTFDESMREYQLRSSIGPLVQGMKLSPFVNVPQQEYDRVKFLNNLFYEIINKLRQEYAPTIEMTKHEKKYLLHYLNNSSFYSLIADIFSLETDDFEKLSDEDLMQAWLHPETIKIIEEKNNGR